MDKITRYKIRQIDSKGIQERSGEIHRREYEYKTLAMSKRFYKYNNGRNGGTKMYKQIIIARKDLNMSPGKLAAQVSHASMAFLSWTIRNNITKIIDEKLGRAWECPNKPQYYRHPDLNKFAEIAREEGKKVFCYKPLNPNYPYGAQVMCEHTTAKEYSTKFIIGKDLYEQWLNGIFTKCILEAKNKNKLLKAKKMAEDMGMKENEDFFLIRDCCLTELEPEDEDGRTLTCIGFRPMDSEIIDKIGKKYQLYK